MKLLLFLLFIISINLSGQDKFLIESGFVITHFQQQVKMEVGDPRGERLSNNFELGLYLSGTYRMAKYISAGIFLRLDRGERSQANFAGFDSLGRAKTDNEIGGTYTEFWAGPLVKFNWNYLHLDVGYGLIGIRKDLGRNDIPSISGSTENSFNTLPSISWLVSLGGNFPVTNHIDIMIKIEYRNRYYNERGDEPLINNIEHGTQSISPIIGAAFRF